MEEIPNTNLIEEAVKELRSIIAEVAILGANDSEIPSIEELIKKVQVGEITPEKAIEEANLIKNRKQDYH